MQVRIPLPAIEIQRAWIGVLDRTSTSVQLLERAEATGMSAAEEYLAAKEFEIWPDDALLGAPELADVTEFLARGRQSAQGPSDHVLIKTQHVQMGRYVPSSATLDPGAASRVPPAALLKPGDVLVACSAAGCLGRVARFDDPDVIASTNTHIAIARADRAQVTPTYLYAYLLGAQGQFQLRSRERGDWARQKVGFRLTELNLRDLQQVPIPLPSLGEQERVVRRLDTIKERLGGLERLFEQRAKLTESIVAAFMGRVTGDLPDLG